jgi:hypothetical protein
MAPNNKTPIIHRYRVILLTCILLSISFSILSAQKKNEEIYPYDQKEQAPPAKERLFYGGSFGLMFGSVTDIKVSPVVGYWLLPRIAVAAGPTYWYYKDYNLGKTSVYGGRGYMQFVVIQDFSRLIPGSGRTGFFLHLEDELLSLKANFWTPLPANPPGRILVNTVLAGGGLSQQIGKRASVNFMVLWPLTEPTNLYELYSKPEIRVSFTF